MDFRRLFLAAHETTADVTDKIFDFWATGKHRNAATETGTGMEAA